MGVLREVSVTVADGETASTWARAGQEGLVGVLIPASFEGTAFSFRAQFGRSAPSAGGGYVVTDLGGAAQAAAAVASEEYVIIAPGGLFCDWVRLECGTAQTGAAVFKLYFRALH